MVGLEYTYKNVDWENYQNLLYIHSNLKEQILERNKSSCNIRFEEQEKWSHKRSFRTISPN